ncbi:hypothetical protein NUU61_002448 [Penicillium alfredii]|uniref:G-protein coupled receptors family 2 profile 2 domain-containing protein n=1 Tax=Penicillium alfredii TaxID=1506179 RepID=A0A9W9FRI8_9EURO|nr:uncharacterized protein NUU61_002448 [Penicillium alfredii]KAJ5105101.1 hypothetical protein NUU61_002448 [Penicillium alfredii]
MSPSARQLSAISATERVCSAVSLIGASVIVATFIGSRSFRKPINRLVFYASWGNLMANIATLISQSGIHAGAGSSLCQFQAFLIQWFMPADALWTFAMACNVYLTFFHKYNSEQLRQLEWKYVICCYGLPFIPAFTYFFVQTQARGRVYGSAILWCWVSLPWDYLRIAVFYGPVWFVISLTFAIYLRAGTVIYRKRRQLRDLGGIDSLDTEVQPESPIVKLSGIQVTSEFACFSPERRSTSTRECVPTRSFTSTTRSPYSVTIEGGGVGASSMPLGLSTMMTSSQESGPRIGPSPLRTDILLKTARPDLADSYSQRRVMTSESNSTIWAYTKYAMLFFIALLVTWVPSTANRVYALARPQDFSFGLNYASSFVLPLQGFWNSLIYVSISWPAFKSLWADLRGRGSGLDQNARFSGGVYSNYSPKQSRDSRASVSQFESTQELADG